MPQMNHTGPEGKGPRTRRGLGRCRKPVDATADSEEYQMGKGMGIKRKSGGGKSKGRRIFNLSSDFFCENCSAFQSASPTVPLVNCLSWE
jgi:hypothetical protein